MSTNRRQCPDCGKVFTKSQYRKSHQSQTKGSCSKDTKKKSGQISTESNETVPTSSSPRVELPVVPNEYEVPTVEMEKLDGLDESDSDDEGSIDSPPNAATTPEQLRDQIQQLLLDMISEQRGHAKSPPGAEGPTEAEETVPHVTMRKPPADVDQAVMEFINGLLVREGILGADTQSEGGSKSESESKSKGKGKGKSKSKSKSETGSDDNDSVTDRQTNTDPDEVEVELILDMGYYKDEDETHQEYDQDHNSVVDQNVTASPTSDVSMASVDYGESQELPVDETNMSRAHLRPCLNQLQQLHQQKMRANYLPSWPFADWPEFEFVK
ncbi:hypothetical protein FRC11_014670 [Ceratobasidium sp. 423]|nr:hypothetical protein FRC11_014670 [Ceratobasidium sp. 423]